MGAWGAGIFENDTASDWLWTYEDDGAPAVEAAFQTAADEAASGEIDADTGSVALAAAEVVAAALGAPAAEIDDEQRETLAKHAEAVRTLPDIRQRAVSAAMTVMGQAPDGSHVPSELVVLWLEDGVDDADTAAFLAAVKDLGQRLKGVEKE